MTKKPKKTRSAPPSEAQRWRHKKRGTSYYEIGLARLQVAPTTILIDGSMLVVYRSVDDDSLWVRHRDEFLDGRFERLK